MWTYKQSTGELIRPNGIKALYGFAGRSVGINNPKAQDIKDVGPLPRGKYTMSSWVAHDPHLGLCVIVLSPHLDNQMLGRAGFRIHGARSLERSGLAMFLDSSEGCIVIGSCLDRESIWKSGDRELEVVA